MKTCLLLLTLALAATAGAQDRTVGLVQYDERTEPGYYLFSPKGLKQTFLVNECGEKIAEWTSPYDVGNIEYLMPDGNLVRAGNPGQTVIPGAGGKGGRFEIRDWSNNLLWEYVMDDSTQLAHHDFRVKDNGNLLVLVWDVRSKAEAIANGRDTALLTEDGLWSEKIVELRPILPDSAEIVWEWYLWDHLIQDFDPTKANYGDVSAHPERLDINHTRIIGADWIHANAFDYNPVLDQVLFGSRDLNEFFIIDHSTTTEEAAGTTGGRWGKGGDILFRWGNPAGYKQGDAGDQTLYDPHGVNWIDAGLPNAGDLLIFNCGVGRPEGEYSTVLRIRPETDSDTAYVLEDGVFALALETTVYEADPPEDFFAGLLSAAQQLPDGNLMISDGPHGTLFEVTPAGETYWKYIIPAENRALLEQGEEVPVRNATSWFNFTFRGQKYYPDFGGFAGKDLSVKGAVELNPLPTTLCDVALTGVIGNTFLPDGLDVYPNPAPRQGSLWIDLKQTDLSIARATLLNASAQQVSATWTTTGQAPHRLDLPSQTGPGLYILKLEFTGKQATQPAFVKVMVY